MESVRGYDFADPVRPQPLAVQLLGWPFGGDVLGAEPDHVSFLELGSFQTAAIDRPLILSLGDCHLFFTVPVKFREGLREIVGGRIDSRHIQGKSGSRIIPVVGKERRDLSGRVRGIVVSELGDG